MFEGFDSAFRLFIGQVSPIAPVAILLGWQHVLMYMAAGYLMGSIPSAVIIGKLMGVADVRQVGSKNIGAANMLRAGGTLPAVLTLVADAGKCALITWYCLDFGPDIIAAGVIGCIFGHLFPVWLKFRGGKGVAVYFGACWVLSPWSALIASGVWFITFIATRYSSVASLLAVLAPPIVAYQLFDEPQMRLYGFLAVVIWAAHYGNIKRLCGRSENRFRFGKQEASKE